MQNTAMRTTPTGPRRRASPLRRLGDVNGDGVIDNLDAAMVYAAYNGKGTLSDEQAACADVNGDGVIDNLDASMIYAYYSGRLEKFPAEKGN